MDKSKSVSKGDPTSSFAKVTLAEVCVGSEISIGCVDDAIFEIFEVVSGTIHVNDDVVTHLH